MNEVSDSNLMNSSFGSSKLYRKFNDWQLTSTPQQIKLYYNNNFIKNKSKNKSQHAFFEIPNQLWDMELLSLGIRQNKVFPPDNAWLPITIKEIRNLSHITYNKADYIDTGGCVKFLSWCPNLSDHRQILAIYVSSNNGNHELNLKPQENSDFIQIWDFGSYIERHSRPKMLHRFKHQWGHITSMQWISPDEPNVESVQKFPYLNKDFVKPQALLGHILFCCTDGFMRICPIPKFSHDQMKNGDKKTLIFNPDYVLKAGVGHDYLYDSRKFFGYPTCASWNSSFPGWFVAGYSTGHIGVFDLTCANLFHYDCKNHYLISIHKRKLSQYPITSISMSPYDWQVFNYTVDSGDPSNCNFVHKFTEHAPPVVVLDSSEVVRSCTWPFRSDLLVTVSRHGSSVDVRSLLSGRVASVPVHGVVNVVPFDADNSILVATEAGSLVSISLSEPSIIRYLMTADSEEDFLQPLNIRHYRLTTSKEHSRSKEQKMVDCVTQEDVVALHETTSSVGYPLISTIDINQNTGANNWVAVGFSCGIVHLLQIEDREAAVSTALDNQGQSIMDTEFIENNGDAKSTKISRSNVRITSKNELIKEESSKLLLEERKMVIGGTDILSIAEQESMVEILEPEGNPEPLISVDENKDSNVQSSENVYDMDFKSPSPIALLEEMECSQGEETEHLEETKISLKPDQLVQENKFNSLGKLDNDEEIKDLVQEEKYIESPICEDHTKDSSIFEMATIEEPMDDKVVSEVEVTCTNNDNQIEEKEEKDDDKEDVNDPNNSSRIQIVFDDSDLNVDYDDAPQSNNSSPPYEDIEENLEIPTSQVVVTSSLSDNIFDRLSKSLLIPVKEIETGDESQINLKNKEVLEPTMEENDRLLEETKDIPDIDNEVIEHVNEMIVESNEVVLEPSVIVVEMIVESKEMIESNEELLGLVVESKDLDVESKDKVLESTMKLKEKVSELDLESKEKVVEIESAIESNEVLEEDIELKEKVLELESAMQLKEVLERDIESNNQVSIETKEVFEEDAELKEEVLQLDIESRNRLLESGNEPNEVIEEYIQLKENVLDSDMQSKNVILESVKESKEVMEDDIKSKEKVFALDVESKKFVLEKTVESKVESTEKSSEAFITLRKEDEEVVEVVELTDRSEAAEEGKRKRPAPEEAQETVTRHKKARLEETGAKKRGRQSRVPKESDVEVEKRAKSPEAQLVAMVDLSLRNVCGPEDPPRPMKKSAGSGRRSSGAAGAWWRARRVTLAWTEGRYQGVQQTVTGRLFDEEPVVGQVAMVRWSKPTSASKYPALVVAVLE